MRPETREAMEQLFAAKWNVPKAAAHCNLDWKSMKIVFSEYCRLNPATYVLDSEDEVNLQSGTVGQGEAL